MVTPGIVPAYDETKAQGKEDAMSENNKVEARMFNPFENFTGRLDKEFQCKVVNVEYSPCGNYYSKSKGRNFKSPRSEKTLLS